MNRTLLFILLFIGATAYAAEQVGLNQQTGVLAKPGTSDQLCTGRLAWPKAIYNCFRHIWNDGDNELYLSGYAWHNRYTYRPEKIKSFNENAWGGGFGKDLYDEQGDLHGLYAFVFSDSHSSPEPVLGYSFLKVARLSTSLRVGAGYAVLVTARPDIFHGIPFPGALPWVSVIWHRATLSATYIPGAQGAGNVLYFVGKWKLDKP